jgi:uncharacterized protein with PQ loop repeat
MFCPNCGKSDQKSDTYCRQCGEFIFNPSNKFNPLSAFLGGGNPEKQINLGIFISLTTAIASFLLVGFLIGYYEAHFERTGESAPTVVYAVYVFLALVGFWQFLSLIIGLQVKSKFNRRKSIDGENVFVPQENVLSSAETRELLPEADTQNLVDTSVTENTTRNLVSEKRK